MTTTQEPEIIFELFDNILADGGEGHLSYHKTRKGAMTAMSDAITKMTGAICRDYEGDIKNDFTLSFTIKPCKVLE